MKPTGVLAHADIQAGERLLRVPGSRLGKGGGSLREVLRFMSVLRVDATATGTPSLRCSAYEFANHSRTQPRSNLAYGAAVVKCLQPCVLKLILTNLCELAMDCEGCPYPTNLPSREGFFRKVAGVPIEVRGA
eukprot:5236405-Amphidinium_carterae.1